MPTPGRRVLMAKWRLCEIRYYGLRWIEVKEHVIICSCSFSGAQDTPTRRGAQREGATWIGSVAKWCLRHLQTLVLLGWGLGAGCSREAGGCISRHLYFWAGGWGLGAPGPDGQALPGTAQNPARLVYGSAALVASLRGQQSHFATLPMK